MKITVTRPPAAAPDWQPPKTTEVTDAQKSCDSPSGPGFFLFLPVIVEQLRCFVSSVRGGIF